MKTCPELTLFCWKDFIGQKGLQGPVGPNTVVLAQSRQPGQLSDSILLKFAVSQLYTAGKLHYRRMRQNEACSHSCFIYRKFSMKCSPALWSGSIIDYFLTIFDVIFRFHFINCLPCLFQRPMHKFSKQSCVQLYTTSTFMITQHTRTVTIPRVTRKIQLKKILQKFPCFVETAALRCLCKQSISPASQHQRFCLWNGFPSYGKTSF